MNCSKCGGPMKMRVSFEGAEFLGCKTWRKCGRRNYEGDVIGADDWEALKDMALAAEEGRYQAARFEFANKQPAAVVGAKTIKLPYPIMCESHDPDGTWLMVTLMEYLGNDKWQGFDEDGKMVVVDARQLSKPTMGVMPP